MIPFCLYEIVLTGSMNYMSDEDLYKAIILIDPSSAERLKGCRSFMDCYLYNSAHRICLKEAFRQIVAPICITLCRMSTLKIGTFSLRSNCKNFVTPASLFKLPTQVLDLPKDCILLISYWLYQTRLEYDIWFPVWKRLKSQAAETNLHRRKKLDNKSTPITSLKLLRKIEDDTFITSHKLSNCHRFLPLF